MYGPDSRFDSVQMKRTKAMDVADWIIAYPMALFYIACILLYPAMMLFKLIFDY